MQAENATHAFCGEDAELCEEATLCVEVGASCAT
jgi:hypothetical protein